FEQIQMPTDLPITFGFQIDERKLIFSLTIAVLSVLVFGLVPAIRTARADLADAIKTGDTGLSGRRRLWGRSVLVAGQVAVTLVLLTVSAFMYRGFHGALSGTQGFRRDHLLMMSMDPNLVHYKDDETERFYKQLMERTQEVTGVKSVTLASSIP